MLLSSDGDDVDSVELAESVGARILGGECASCEFKPWVDPNRANVKFKEILRTVVAMGNTAGGCIFIGVKDSGDVQRLDGKVLGRYIAEASQKLGHDASDDERKLEAIQIYGTKVRDEIQKGVNPSAELQLQPVNLESGKVLLICVDPGPQRPYELVENHEVLVRSNATNRRPTLEERSQLHQPAVVENSRHNR